MIPMLNFEALPLIDWTGVVGGSDPAIHPLCSASKIPNRFTGQGQQQYVNPLPGAEKPRSPICHPEQGLCAQSDGACVRVVQ